MIIPQTLQNLQQWVLWRRLERDGRPTKVPYTPAGTPASVSDPNTWTDFETALEAYQRGGFDGIGFVLTWDQYIVCVDLDHAKNGTDWTPEAKEIVRLLNSYTEVSPSGQGLHIWCLGKLPAGRRRKNGVEMYDSGRFITVTGKHLAFSPTDLQDRSNELVELYKQVFGDISVPAKCQELSVCNTDNLLDLDDQELLEKAMNAENGAKFRALWNGDTSGYQSQSEADLALCRLLAFWTGNDPERIERLFGQSALGNREKWQTRRDYRQSTIQTALQSLHESYSPKSEKSLYGAARGLKRDFEEMPPAPTTDTIQTLYGAARGLSEPSSEMAAPDDNVHAAGAGIWADTGGGHGELAGGAEQCPFGPDCPFCAGQQLEQQQAQQQHPTVFALEEDSNPLVSARFSDRAETILFLDPLELYKNCSTKTETSVTCERNDCDISRNECDIETETNVTQKRNECDMPGEQLGSAYLRQPTARERILWLAQRERSINAKSVAAELDCSEAAARQALARLAASGELERIGHGEYSLRRPFNGALSISEFARRHGISESAARLRLMRMVRAGKASRVANGTYEILPENWQRVTATIVRVEQVQLSGVQTFRISLVADGRHFQIFADRGSSKLLRIMQAAGLEIGARVSELELRDILISVCLVHERSRRFYKVVAVWARSGDRLLWRFDNNRNHSTGKEDIDNG